MLELEIGLVDAGELNFDKSFLQFNAKKNICEVTLKDHFQLDWKCECWTMLKQLIL